MLPRLSRNQRPVLLHLLPEFQAGAPLAFVIDLAKKLTEYSHVLLTNRPVGEVEPYQDELCTKLGLDVRYTAQREIRKVDVEACRPDVAIIYDVRASDLADPIECAPYIYYAHYRYDELVGYGCRAHVFGTRDLGSTVQPKMYFPPYIDHSMVMNAAKKPQPPTRKRAIAMLAGRPESYDFEFAAGVIEGVDFAKVGFILPPFNGINEAYDRALGRAQAADSVMLCPYVPGATYNAYRRTQTLLSTGCFRIDAECGVLRRPVIRKPDSVAEAVEIIEKSLVDRGFIDELIDYGRQIAAERQLDLHIHQLSNLVRRLY
jgi:hypothetical protein